MAWYDYYATMTTLNDLFKEILNPVVQEWLNRKTQIYSILTRRTESLVGKQWEMAGNVLGNEGIGVVGERAAGAGGVGGQLPEAGAQQFDRVSLIPRLSTGRILFGFHAMERSASDVGALASALDTEVMGLVKDFQIDMCRVMYGNGTGILCTAGAGMGAGIVAPGGVADNLTVQDTYGIVSGDPRPNRLLRVGMIIADINAGAGVSSGRVTAVNADGVHATITTLAGAPNFGAAGHYITRSNVLQVAAPNVADTGYGTIATTDTQREQWGLQNIADDNAFMGVDGATSSWWASYTDDMGGAVITEEDVQELLDEVDILSGTRPNTMITSHIIRRKLANLLMADRRFVNEMTYRGGWKAVEVAGYPLLADKHCPQDKLFALDLNDIIVKQTHPPAWVETDGHFLHRRENYLEFQGVLAWYWNTGAHDRKKHACLYNASCA